MSSKVDVTDIDAKLFEGFVLKAASKAYSKVFDSGLNISRVVSGGLQHYPSAHEL